MHGRCSLVGPIYRFDDFRCVHGKRTVKHTQRIGQFLSISSAFYDQSNAHNIILAVAVIHRPLDDYMRDRKPALSARLKCFSQRATAALVS